jgi:predicted phosphoribosyltransferase
MTLFESLKDKFQLRFKNREVAAKILAGALEDSLGKIKIDKNKDVLLLLGIPRGGVLVGDIIASKLTYKCEFDIVVPRKLTAPFNQEIAIGAVMEDGTTFLNNDIIAELEADEKYIENEKVRQLEEVNRRNRVYQGLKEPIKVQDRIDFVSEFESNKKPY